MDDADRTWLETKFREIHEKIDKKESAVTAMKIDVETLKLNAPHKCADEIRKHEAGSWAHNPIKATGLLATVLGIAEGIKKFFGH